MTRYLPQQIHPAGFDAIRQESARLNKEAIDQGGKRWEDYDADIQLQQVFLDAFEKTFHVRSSMMIAGVDYSRYKKWRTVSISFVERFNNIIEQWHDDIFASAAVRARGHCREDEETGEVSFFDADTQLTKMFLKAMYSQFDEKIDMSLTGGLNNTTTTLDPEKYAEVRKKMIDNDDC